MNIGNPKLIKQLESLVDNRQDWLFRFAYIRIGQREDAEDIVQDDNLTFREIAELEEIPEATVKSRYRYAIQHIQQRLRKEKSI